MKRFSFLKYLLAAIPIIWIFSRINFKDLTFVIAQTSWWTIPVLLLSNLLVLFLQGIRWWLLIRTFLPEVSLTRTLSFHFIGVFYSVILPSSASQDFVRAILISREQDYSVIWASTWISRLLGMIVLFILSLYGFFSLSDTETVKSLEYLVISFFIILCIFIALSFSKRTTRPFRGLIKKISPAKLFSGFERIRNGIYLYRERKKDIALVFIITLCTHLILFISAAFIILGISGKLFIAEALAYIPLIEFACMTVPITPNGMGLRELLSKAMFDHLGLSSEQLGVYILVFLFSTLLRLTGGIPLLFLKSKKSGLSRQHKNHM
ncbi:MAG: flippase-like domain-containing protein [Chitinivibrionales bacterium]|nr:flippase-like domain-containing protein [Chitinivibrionales bacterium]